MTVTTIKSSEETEADDKKKGGKKKLILIVAGMLLGGGAAYWFLFGPTGGDQEAAPVPGVILPLDSTQINLASGHYLKIGIALQLAEGAPAELDGSKALDATIELFTGRSVGDVANARERNRLKEELERTLAESYDQQVLGVYFREFVTQ